MITYETIESLYAAIVLVVASVVTGIVLGYLKNRN